jgi:hypothetical protein
VIEAEVGLSRRRAALLLASAAAALLASAVPDYFASGSAPRGNDNSSHYAEILVIADHLKAGDTDFWFDQTNLGYPLFLAYQPLPSLVMGALTALSGGFISSLTLFKLSILAVWACMPAAWYLGGRWLGMGRTAASLLGLAIFVVNDFRSFGLGLSSALGNGLYTQSWGALLLPLSLGSIYRLLYPRTGGYGTPALLLALTFLCHAFLGVYASLAAALLAIAQTRGVLPRMRALLGVYGLALLLLAFWLIPFLANLDYQGGLPWKHESENGYPPVDLLRMALVGALFDQGRAPWLTALVFAGIVLSWRQRAQTLDRWLLALFALTVALLLGRATWGVVYDRIPLHAELEVIRYLGGLHFCGLALASLGVSRLLPYLPALLDRLSGPPWLSASRSLRAIATIVLVGYLAGTYTNGRRFLRTFDTAQPGFAGALATLRQNTDARFLVHKRLGSINHFHLNLLPALAARPQLESFSRGYHDTLSLYYVEYFDFSPAAFHLYNVGAALVGDGQTELLPGSFRETWAGGGLRVFEAPNPPGYFAFVRMPLTVVGDFRRIRPFLRWTSTELYEKGVVARLARQAPTGGERVVVGENGRFDYTASDGTARRDVSLAQLLPLLVERHAAPASRSRVVEESSAPNEYRALVDAAGGDEKLLLKASYHPGWQAWVDGLQTEIDHAAPNLMAIPVPPGRHEVRFRYRNPHYQKLLFAGSLGGVLAWAGYAAMRARGRVRRTSA